MKTRNMVLTLIVALMSITFLSGCGNPNRHDGTPRIVENPSRTNNDYNYQNNEGGIVNTIMGNRHTSNGPDQPEYTYERKGGILGFLFGDVRKTNGPVSSGAPRQTKKQPSSGKSKQSNTRGSIAW